MRLAVLSDIHGNLLALEAVLADIQDRGAPDAYWVLGDLAAFCPWPVETLDRLRELPDVSFLRGNTDRYLVTGRRPAMTVRSAEDWVRYPAALAMRDANFRWTVKQLSYADYDFLHDLPAELGMTVPGHGRVVAFHATPADDETNILPSTPDAQVAARLAGLDARLVLYGHTHRPIDRTVGTMRLVNDGSVGMPMDGDPRPAYALLDFEGEECGIAIHRVAYDVEPVIAELEQVKHPAREWVGGVLRRAAPANAS